MLTTDTLHLHSYALRISDPAKPGKKVVIQAPLPPHMQNTFRTFDFNASPNVDWVEDNLKAKFKPEERKKHRLWEERAKTKKGKGARNIGATKTMQQRAIKAQKVKLAKTRQRARAKEKAKSSAKRK